MRKFFLRLLSEPEAVALNAQAARGETREPERSQFAHLLRHFLERFFNHETASADGDAKTRLVQVAFAAGLPGFVVSLYLWPIYHPLLGWAGATGGHEGRPPYWLQVNHHLFFVVYSFAAMGMVTVFEWDMFFPDLLDIFVLKPLPVAGATTFLARVAAIVLLLGGFLFDANFLAPLVLPAAIDPPDLFRFLAGHVPAVAASGLFAALLVLAFECVVLSVAGERWFRRFSLLLQGLAIAAFSMLLLLFPVVSAIVPDLLKSGAWYVRWFPPFWFLGIYQSMLEGAAAPAIYAELARTGCWATLGAAAVVFFTYPIAYVRRTRQLIEGGDARGHRNRAGWGISRLVSRWVNAAVVRLPERRAVFHYITQTLFRVPRYRIYLVLYGGVGLAIVLASVLRLSVVHNEVRAAVSAEGLRASIGIAVFWIVTGLRIAFLSPGNRQGSWIFQMIHGLPPEMETLLERLRAAKIWALLFVAVLTGALLPIVFAVAGPEAVTGPEMVTWRAAGAEFLVAAGLCVVLTDLAFFDVTAVAFTGEGTRESSNPAVAIAKYLTVFPIVVWVSSSAGPWMERSGWGYAAVAVCVFVAHRALELRHREVVGQHCRLFEFDGDQSSGLLRLDLRRYGPGEEDGGVADASRIGASRIGID